MRLIDADALRAAITVDGYEHFSVCLSSSEVSLLEMVMNDIDEAPTIDAVPVVRCVQCRYERPEVDAYTQETVGHWCSLHDIGSLQDSNFCAYGERKEGADNE